MVLKMWLQQHNLTHAFLVRLMTLMDKEQQRFQLWQLWLGFILKLLGQLMFVIGGQTFTYNATPSATTWSNATELATLVNANTTLNVKYTATVSGAALVLTQKPGQESPTTPVVTGATQTITTVGVTGVAAIPAGESATSIRVPGTIPGTTNVNPLYGAANLSFSKLSDREIQVTSTVNNLAGDAAFYVHLGQVYTDDSASDGPINFSLVTPNGSGFPAGSVAVGNIQGSGLVDITTNGTDTGNNSFNFNLRLQEAIQGSLKSGNQTLKVKLPDGYKWDTTGGTALVNASGVAMGDIIGNKIFGDNLNVTVSRSDDRTLLITTVADSSAPTYLELQNLTFHVEDDAKVQAGDIQAEIYGDSSTDVKEVKVGTYGDFGATVKADATDLPTIVSGKTDVDSTEISDIDLNESLQGTLIPGRTVTFTLPEGAKWYQGQLDSGDNDNGVSLGTPVLSNNDRTLKYTVGGSLSTDLAALTLENMHVVTQPGFNSKDLSVTVAGTAGVTGDVTLAHVVDAVTATADQPTSVKLGLGDQAISDFTITENAKGALTKEAGYDTVVLHLPDGAKFVGVPTVAVTDGDLNIKDVQLTNNDQDLEFTVDGTSDVASKIKVSGAKVQLYRYLPEGALTVSVQGGAAVDVNRTDNAAHEDSNGDAFFNGTDTASKVTVANVVTPAPGETTASAKFTIGQTSYTVNGVQKTLDVAPYTEGGRTYLPIRFVAEALGVTDDNIIWNDANKTVTLINGNRIASFKVGQSSYTVNGAVVPMDAAAQFKQNRNMIPLRYAAQALGVAIGWDDATQTVTVGSAVQQ
jgi:trimeric autotransporter adhesin